MKRDWLTGAGVVVLALGLLPAAPLARTPQQAPIRVGGSIVEPRMIKHVDPAYPEAARAAGIGGVVILEVTIGPDGRVSNAMVLRHVDLLDDAALAAVMQWEFQPTLLIGVAVPVIMTTTVNFSPQSSSGVPAPPPPPTSPQPSLVASATPAAGQITAGRGVPAPTKIKDVTPELPDSAKQAGVTGIVLLDITIGTTGKVQNIRMLRHLPESADAGRAVLDAVKQWEFAPTLVNGLPVAVNMAVRVTFTKDGVQITTPPEVVPATNPAAAGDTPASPVPNGQPLRVGGNIREPVKVKDVAPVYPRDALRARLQGNVIIEAVIDAEGNVANAKVLNSAAPSLDAAALDAVKQWKFAPTMINGVPVPIVMVVTVRFVI